MDITHMQMTHDAEGIIARAARACCKQVTNEPEDDNRLIERMIALGELSILEHASATFHIKGISRGSINKLFQQGLPSSTIKNTEAILHEDLEIVVPESVAKDEEALEGLEAVAKMCKRNYDRVIGMGIPPEDARYFLPEATSTEIIITMDFRELRHFLNLAEHSESNNEIQELIKKMQKTLHAMAPSVFGDLNTGV